MSSNLAHGIPDAKRLIPNADRNHACDSPAPACPAAPTGRIPMPTGLTLTPVPARFSLQDHVYDVLRQAILDMDIYDAATDLRLDERGLADQLNISRTPLRATLLRLEQEGFVTIQPRRGVVVVRKSLDEILDMITVWAALESMAARIVAVRATAADLADLRHLATGGTTGGATGTAPGSLTIAEYSESNIAFHQAILRLAGQPLLQQITEGLFLHMRAVRRRAMAEGDRADRSVEDHLDIITALEARDADRAGTAVRDHTLKLHDHVRRTWTELGLADLPAPQPGRRGRLAG